MSELPSHNPYEDSDEINARLKAAADSWPIVPIDALGSDRDVDDAINRILGRGSETDEE